MRLTAPSFIVLLISVLVAGAVIAERYFGVSIPIIGSEIKHFATLLVAYVVLLLGVLIKGI